MRHPCHEISRPIEVLSEGSLCRQNRHHQELGVHRHQLAVRGTCRQSTSAEPAENDRVHRGASAIELALEIRATNRSAASQGPGSPEGGGEREHVESPIRMVRLTLLADVERLVVETRSSGCTASQRRSATPRRSGRRERSPVTWKSISGVMVSLTSTSGPAAAGSMNCAVRNAPCSG